jgi:hypothetical protein
MTIRRIVLWFIPLTIAPAIFADSWSPIMIVNAPTARAAHSAVFTRIDGTSPPTTVLFKESTNLCLPAGTIAGEASVFRD